MKNRQLENMVQSKKNNQSTSNIYFNNYLKHHLAQLFLFVSHLPELYCVYCWYCGWKLWMASVMISLGFMVS